MNIIVLRNAIHVKSDGITGVIDCIPDDGSMPIVYDTLERYSKMIPDGVYPITMTYSPKFRRPLPLINNVPHRSGIRIHPGNVPADSTGCILVGRKVPYEAKLLNSYVACKKLNDLINLAIARGEKVSIQFKTQPRLPQFDK